MSFIPEDKEERKWITSIAIVVVPITVVSFILFTYYMSLYSETIFYIVPLVIFTFYGVVLPGIFFSVGVIVGVLSNLQPAKCQDVCIKGAIFSEISLLILFFIGGALFISAFILEMIMLFIPILFCGIGGYYGAKFR